MDIDGNVALVTGGASVEHLITNRSMSGHVVRLDGAIRFDPK